MGSLASSAARAWAAGDDVVGVGDHVGVADLDRLVRPDELAGQDQVVQAVGGDVAARDREDPLRHREADRGLDQAPAEVAARGDRVVGAHRQDRPARDRVAGDRGHDRARLQPDAVHRAAEVDEQLGEPGRVQRAQHLHVQPGREHPRPPDQHDGRVLRAGVEGPAQLGEEGRVERVDLAVVHRERRDAVVGDRAGDRHHAIPTSSAVAITWPLAALRTSARVAPGRDVQLGVQRVEAEEVAVRPAVVLGRGSGVAGLVELVEALAQLDGLVDQHVAREALGQLAVLGQQRVHQPVGEDALVGVGVLDDQHQLLGPVRHALPGQRRREVVGVLGVLDRDLPVVGEGGADEAEGRHGRAVLLIRWSRSLGVDRGTARGAATVTTPSRSRWATNARRRSSSPARPTSCRPTGSPCGIHADAHAGRRQPREVRRERVRRHLREQVGVHDPGLGRAGGDLGHGVASIGVTSTSTSRNALANVRASSVRTCCART